MLGGGQPWWDLERPRGHAEHARGAGAAPVPPPASILAAGARVLARDLVSAPQHNGREGTVRGYDAASGRYDVRMADGARLSVKPANLLQSVGVEVVDPEGPLHGTVGRVVGADAAARRYHVSVQGTAASLPSHGVILPKGARARVLGLTTPSGAVWNGAVGEVLEFDRRAARYALRMGGEREHVLRVRLEHAWLL